jgi:hypothetical protein
MEVCRNAVSQGNAVRADRRRHRHRANERSCFRHNPYPTEVARLEAAAIDAKVGPRLKVGDACIEEGKLEDSCTRSTPVVLWGDSHAAHHWGGLTQIFGVDGINYYGTGGCPPLLGVTPVIVPASGMAVVGAAAREAGEECKRINDATIRSLKAKGNVRLVVLGGAWQFFSEGVKLSVGLRRFLVTTPGEPLTREITRRALREGLLRTVRELRSAGVSVLVMGDVPENRVSPQQCMSRAAMRGHGFSHCELAPDALERLRFSNELLTELDRIDGVAVFKPSDHLCANGHCPILIGSVPVYADADHITPATSRLFAQWYLAGQ